MTDKQLAERFQEYAKMARERGDEKRAEQWEWRAYRARRTA